MAEALAEYLSQKTTGEFRAVPFYEKATDSLIFYARDERSYGKRINRQFTLFLSIADNSLVGCEVKGVARLCRHLGDFGVLVADHDVDLMILIGFATVGGPEDPDAEQAFEREIPVLKKIADDIKVDVGQWASAC